MSAPSSSRRAPLSRFLVVVILLGAIVMIVHGIRMRAVDPAWGSSLITWGGASAFALSIVVCLPHRVRVNVGLTLAAVITASFGFNVLPMP